MRLLVIDPGLRLWGSEKALLATLPDLLHFNDKVVVVIPPNSEIIPELEVVGVTFCEAPIGDLYSSGWLGRIRAVVAIVRACQHYKIDKIYLNQGGLCRIIYFAAAILRLPLVIHVRLFEDISRCASLPSWPPIDLIYVSRDMLRRHPSRSGKRALWAYDPYLSHSDRREEADETNRTRLFCCVGRIAPAKGQLELLRAFTKFRAIEYHDATLDIIGAPSSPGEEYYIKIRKLAGPLIEDRAVRFLGYQTQVHEILGSYSFVVVPSHYESLGRVVMEAWDAGAIPICSRDSGGCSEMVSHSGGGILYNGHGPDEIALALIEAAKMPRENRQRLVCKGRAWVRDNLSSSAYRIALSGVIFPNFDEQSEKQ